MQPTIKNSPLWLDNSEVPERYPWLAVDEHAEVCVIGGGITGALCAMELGKNGVDTVLLSASPVGLGLSAYSSGVMQCDGGTCLSSLVDDIGADKATRFIEACEQAMQEVEDLCQSFDLDCGFARRDSLLFCDSEEQLADLKQEYLVRRRCSVPSAMVDGLSFQESFSFPLAGGILTPRRAATVNPYLFCHGVLREAVKAGVRVYESTAVDSVSEQTSGYVLKTSTHRAVSCDRLVIATGSDIADFFTKGLVRRTSFSVATRPMPDLSGAAASCLVQTLGRPETTLFQTQEGRLFFTGLSTSLVGRGGKMMGILPLETLSQRKFAHMADLLSLQFGGVDENDLQYGFSATAVQGENGLPKIGGHPDYEHCFFALSGGENGILYANIASHLLLMHHRGERSPLMGMFSPAPRK